MLAESKRHEEQEAHQRLNKWSQKIVERSKAKGIVTPFDQSPSLTPLAQLPQLDDKAANIFTYDGKSHRSKKFIVLNRANERKVEGV